MTTVRDELVTQLAAYAAGLEAEMALLRQIEALSAAQAQATAGQDIHHLHRIADQRARLMSALVELEAGIAPSRLLLAEHRSIASSMPGFGVVVALHKTAAGIVNGILSADRDTMAALREAEAARRTASQAIEAGEHTLAAYRRVISPGSAGPSLVDRHG